MSRFKRGADAAHDTSEPPSHPVAFTARYDGTCTACGEPIVEDHHRIRRDEWGDGYEHDDPRDCG